MGWELEITTYNNVVGLLFDIYNVDFCFELLNIADKFSEAGSLRRLVDIIKHKYNIVLFDVDNILTGMMEKGEVI